MSKKCAITRRALNILRMALLWIRKQRMAMVEMGILPRLSGREERSLRFHYYGEQELSFEHTPVLRFKMQRPVQSCFRLSCFHSPPSDPDLRWEWTSEDEEEREEEDSSIDVRAERFIEKFREEMRLQRQISCLQYEEEDGGRC